MTEFWWNVALTGMVTFVATGGLAVFVLSKTAYRKLQGKA